MPVNIKTGTVIIVNSATGSVASKGNGLILPSVSTTNCVGSCNLSGCIVWLINIYAICACLVAFDIKGQG